MSVVSAIDAAPAPLTVTRASDTDRVAAYVARHADATAYHDPTWLRVIAAAFGHETYNLVATDSTGAIQGVLPLAHFSSRIFGRFAVSLPFVNYGGVLADHDGAAQALLDGAVAEVRRNGGTHLELRHTVQRFTALHPRRHKVAMRLPLRATGDEQWNALDRKVRNQIRKAEKSGASVAYGSVELLEPFYAVFARNMRDLGTPVYGIRFFTEVLKTFADRTRVFVVTVENRPVAASLVLWHRGMIEVPWASAIRDFNPLCVNVLLYWEMVRFAVERGFRVFDFGRSTPGEGTFHFKRQWGAEPLPLVWEYWTAPGRAVPDMSPHNPKYELAIRSWQRLPLPIATAVGPFIVRNIP
jgi:FemAB-related protein (PEP-CTERM system-associated)